MSDAIALALIRRLIETGALSADDVNIIADRVAREAPMAAHQIRCELLDTMLPSEAEQRRRVIKIIDGGAD